VKDSFCEELERVFYKFSKYNMKILLWEFNARAGIFKPTTGNESLHKISNDNGVIVNFATSKNIATKSNMFPHCSINLIGHILMGTGLATFWSSL
jgi:hypothetical protein